jgi:uncharacterized protein (DUF302 family)
MKSIIIVFALIVLPAIVRAQTESDWIIVSSAHPMKQTVEQLQKVIQEKGFKIFNTIDHAQGAESVGLSLRPTTLVIFGNPKGGTPIMNCDQRMGMILPLKILVWEDESKTVKAGYINPEKYLKEYDLEKCKEVLLKMKNALGDLVKTIEKK